MRRAPSLRLLVLSVVLCVAATPAAAKPLPGYHSPGYAGTKKLPKVKAVSPPKPVLVSSNGHGPHVLVDAAGTAHLAWSTEIPNRPGVLHYCRLPRGGKTCAASFAKAILQPSGSGNGPGTDQDFQGPFPLSVGNELLLLDSRCCNTAPTPDGRGTSNPVYLFTSEDGGGAFTGPEDPNSPAGIIGTLPPTGDAMVFNGNDPIIGTVSDAETGGSSFQGVSAGSFTRQIANLSTRVDHNDAYDGRLALDGIRPVVAFDDLDGVTTVREWNGRGSVNDPATWSVLKIPHAFHSRIAGGASGLLLLSHSTFTGGRLQVRRIAPGAHHAGAPKAIGPATGDTTAITESPSGQAVAGWIDRDGNLPAVRIRTSADGIHWTPGAAIADLKAGTVLDELGLGVTADGGGFASFRARGADDGLLEGKIGLAQFGATAPTGRKGLGLVPGKSGPPAGDKSAYVACTKIHFGNIDALAKAGCFLRDPSHPESGAGVTDGEVRLNGLDIVPDAGVKIGIDPRNKTINTTGKVRVLLDGLGLDPITIWHDELHVDLSAATTGETLFDFDMSRFSSELEGFPFDGRIQVKIEPDAVDAAAHLALPAYFGGVRGDADLKANNKDGFVLDSLHVGIDDANIGVLELKNVFLDYKRTGSRWSGGGELLLPGPLSPDITAEVTFEQGAFKHGSLKLEIKPGIPVFADVYIHSFKLGFGLHPTVIEGEIQAGLYDGIGSYPVNIVGTAKLQIGDAAHPTIFFVGGTGQILGLGLAHASFTYDSDGYVLFHLDAGLAIGPLSASVLGDVFVLHRDFGANLSIKGCLTQAFCVGLDAAASKKGLSVCAGGAPGIDVPDWDPTEFKFHPFSCHMSDYQLQAPPAGGARARAAAAGERTFTVTKGQSAVDLELQGAGGAPTVVLVGPDGRAHGVARVGAKGADTAGLQDPKGDRTFVGVRSPQPGTWTVRPLAGSPAITALATAHVMPLPRLSARVTGHGAVRTLHYRITHVAAATKVQFAEKAREGMRALGKATTRSGTLSFRPGAGPGGRRAILAVVTQNGYTRAQPVIAHYTAPKLRKPGRIARLRIARKGTKLTVRYGSAAGAARYVVRVSATGGLSTQRTTTKHTVVLHGLRRGARISVSVRGVNTRGVRGPTTSRKLGAPAKKKAKKRKHR